MIGQDQDQLGGGFSQSESFKGKMSFVDFWSKLLSEEEIMQHLDDCNAILMGDLYAWVDMFTNIKGNIQLLNSSFCNNCADPKSLYNGLIDIVENRAYYSCNVGYKLSTESYSNGRKCTKASKWEGTYEPYCRSTNNQKMINIPFKMFSFYRNVLRLSGLYSKWIYNRKQVLLSR